jgi:hypothetical protein
VKSVATSVAALAVIGGAAAGITWVAPPSAAQNLPTPNVLANLCNQVTDPGVSYTTKTNLVENGISPGEGRSRSTLRSSTKVATGYCSTTPRSV